MKIKDKYDVIIIGAGLGGLTTGAYLAKEGLDVLIVEKNDKVGGYCVCFERKGFVFDPSLHWVNNLNLVEEVLEDLKINDKIKFLPFEIIAEVRGIDYKVRLDRGVNFFLQDLISLFPSEAKNIQKFVKQSIRLVQEINTLINKTFRLMNWWDKARLAINFILNKYPFIMRYKKTTAIELLDKSFKDNKLKLIFHSLGTTPFSSVFPIMCRIGWSALGDYYYPLPYKSQAISRAIWEVFEQFGGTVLLNTEVKKILIKNNTAIGIKCDKGEIKGKYIVANIDMLRTYKDLIEKNHVPNIFLKKLTSCKIYPSLFLVSLGTNFNLRTFNFKTSTIIWNPTNNLNELMIGDNNPSRCRTIIQMRTLKDPSLAPPGHHTITLGARISYNFMKNYWIKGKEIYEKKKEEIAQKLILSCEQILPGLKNSIICKDIATPLTYEKYTFNTQGAIMGWEEKVKIESQTSFIKNLFHVGHWTFPGGGIPRVLYSAKLVKQLILRNKNADKR